MFREREIAWRRAARHLEIDDSLADLVLPHHLAQHDLQRRVAHRRRDLERVERAVQPRQMQRFVHENPVLHGNHLVDGVGELESAILDMERAPRRAASSGR